ncbi:MAG: hypothetical protein ACRDQI_05625 [Pseudonocardiaceae bacterium]
MSVVLWWRRADGLHRKVGLTGQKSAEVVVPAGDCGVVAGKGRTSSMAEESVVLVPVVVIAAIPLHAGPLLGGDGEVR